MRNYLLTLLLVPFMIKSQTLVQIYVHTDRGAYLFAGNIINLPSFFNPIGSF